MAVAGEELAVLLEQPGELQVRGGEEGGRLDDAGRFATDQLGGDGKEQLVDQAC